MDISICSTDSETDERKTNQTNSAINFDKVDFTLFRIYFQFDCNVFRVSNFTLQVITIKSIENRMSDGNSNARDHFNVSTLYTHTPI